MYYDRLIDNKIKKTLRSAGAIVVQGPKFCGKTTTCMRFQKSYIRLNTEQAISIASMDPGQILTGENPRLIDEWQTVPDIWNQVKNNLDIQYTFGKFILTGSSTPVDTSTIHHSGAGRIVPLKMRPMSLSESHDSKNLVSLTALFEQNQDALIDMNEDFTLEDTAYLLCRGGWPIAAVEDDDRERALDITKNYYNSLFLFEDSANEVFRGKRPEILKLILKSYARNISTEAPYKTILEDVTMHSGKTMDIKTFDSYVNALRDLYIIEDLEAWNPNIRSKTAIRTTSTRHFIDTSVACRAMGITPDDLMKDMSSFGLFFEDMAVRDLVIYADSIGGVVRHYRDNTGLECDAVVHLEDGRWGAIEIKLGGEKLICDGVASLLRLKKKLEEKSDEGSPEFLMVLTATGPLYKTDEDVWIVPINFLTGQ